MNANTYLQSYGWVEGEALQKGGLRKPILVNHKKDNKGLGASNNDTDVWWERLFDGQLKSLEVNSSSKGVSFERNESEVNYHIRKAASPLYKMFVKGEGLKGTVGKSLDPIKSGNVDSAPATGMRMEVSQEKEKERREKKDKNKKKEKKERREKKEKKDKREKKEKKEKKGKREKKDKKNKREKKESTKLDAKKQSEIKSKDNAKHAKAANGSKDIMANFKQGKRSHNSSENTISKRQKIN